MPCFHFDLRGEDETQPGVHLRDLEEARIEAVRLAGDLLRDAPADFWQGGQWNLDVCNCDRKVIFTLAVACHDGPAGVEASEFCPANE